MSTLGNQIEQICHQYACEECSAEEAMVRVREEIDYRDLLEVVNPWEAPLLEFLEAWKRLGDYKESGNPAYEKTCIKDMCAALETKLYELG